ncbi:hypothetical protein IFT68_08225 [Oxalobacteraceae sp. CFBP 13730]|nr:hypothetical protein [Oxalobacteraceae sp. CFBP 13730]
MSKKWPPRPVQDFKIISVQWQIECEATHRRAGFPEVKFGVIQRRFWQLLSFLGQHGYLINAMPTSLEHVTSKTELLSSDLNDDGYAFVQRFEGRWAERLYKDKGVDAEWKFLEKWHAQLLSERANAFSAKAAA